MLVSTVINFLISFNKYRDYFPNVDRERPPLVTFERLNSGTEERRGEGWGGGKDGGSREGNEKSLVKYCVTELFRS